MSDKVRVRMECQKCEDVIDREGDGALVMVINLIGKGDHLQFYPGLSHQLQDEFPFHCPAHVVAKYLRIGEPVPLPEPMMQALEIFLDALATATTEQIRWKLE